MLLTRTYIFVPAESVQLHHIRTVSFEQFMWTWFVLWYHDNYIFIHAFYPCCIRL